MFVGVLVGAGRGVALDGFADVFESTTAPLGIAGGRRRVVFAVGLLDELRKVHGAGVSAPAKIAGIVLAGSILSLAGVSTIFFRVPFLGIFSLTPDLSAFVTVLWVVGMANAINLIDGLDGLAAGITAIAAGAFFVYALRLDDVGVLAAGQRRPADRRARAGRLPRLPAAQLPPRPHLHGRLRRAAARRADGGVDDRRSAARPTTSSAASRSSSSPRCSSRSSSSGCRSSTPCSPSCAAPAPAGRRRRPTRSTSTTACCGSVTATAAACSILWAWTALLSGVVLVPDVHRARATPSCRSASPALGLVLYTVLPPRRPPGPQRRPREDLEPPRRGQDRH